MEGAAGSRHALGTVRVGQNARAGQASGTLTPGLDSGEPRAEHGRDAARARDSGELAAAIALVARGASRWVMVCGLDDAGTLLESTVPSIDGAVRLRRTAPDTILVTGVDSSADLRHRAGARRSRGLLHAVIGVAARVIGE